MLLPSCYVRKRMTRMTIATIMTQSYTRSAQLLAPRSDCRKEGPFSFSRNPQHVWQSAGEDDCIACGSLWHAAWIPVQQNDFEGFSLAHASFNTGTQDNTSNTSFNTLERFGHWLASCCSVVRVVARDPQAKTTQTNSNRSASSPTALPTVTN